MRAIAPPTNSAMRSWLDNLFSFAGSASHEWYDDVDRRSVPDYLMSYRPHQTAAEIPFLVQSEKALPEWAFTGRRDEKYDTL
jgi:hypothetical protein